MSSSVAVDAGPRAPSEGTCCPPLTAQALTTEAAGQLAPMFKALGDPVRLRLLSLIASTDEVCVCDLTGLTQALSHTLHRDDFTPGHDRGRVLTDAAVMMADGGNTIRGIDVLRHQHDLYGPVASAPTLSRALTEIDEAGLCRLDATRATVRSRIWNLITARHGRIPPALVPTGDLGDTIVLRIDAHFIDTVSRKEHAARLRGRYGHHPLAVICDNTGECLAEHLRAGNAGANDAADHIALLTRAVAQLPARYRGNLLITADGAGATHAFLAWITALNRPADGDDPGTRVEYSVGWPVDKHTGQAIALLPAQAWTPMVAADGLPGTPATLDTAGSTSITEPQLRQTRWTC